MKIYTLLLTAAFLLHSLSTQAQTPPPTSDVESRLAEAQTSFQKDLEARAEKFRKEIEEIDPETGDNKAEGAVSLDFDIEWKLQTIKLLVPEVKLTNKEMSLKLPQVALNNKEMIFNIPTTIMRRTKVGEYPEVTTRWVMKRVGFVTTRVPETVVTMRPLYADVPVVEMREKRIVTGVPEFKSEEKKIVMGFPEFTMRQKEIKMHLPQFKLKNIKVEAKKAQKRAEELETAFNQDAATKTATFNDRIGTLVTESITKEFQNARTTLDSQITLVRENYGHGLAIIDNTLKTIMAQGVPDTDKQIADLKAQRTSLLDQQAATLKELGAQLQALVTQEQEVIQKALSEIKTPAPIQPPKG